MTIRNEIIKLKLGEEISIGDLKIIVKDIYYEEIESDPEDTGAYPEGSGINVNLLLKKSDIIENLNLNILTEPYNSHNNEEWKNFRISLVDIEEDMVKLKIEEII